jgi:hypothetical protein
LLRETRLAQTTFSGVEFVARKDFTQQNSHKRPGSALFVPKVTLGTRFRGSLPYIFPGLLPLPQVPISVTDAAISQSLSANALPEGERKTITALFADIKGSTELMRDIDPEEAQFILDPALRLMGEAVRRYDGYVALI